MTKCDFCKYYTPQTGCDWASIMVREDYCEEAIKRMEIALQNIGCRRKR